VGVLDELSTKFKSVERNYERYLNPHKYTIVRLDGHKFHKYTSMYFSSPFDYRIPLALYKATMDICEYISKITAFFYIQSDEVSLFIPDVEFFTEEKGLQDVYYPYNLRVQKLTSLLASFLTAHFNYFVVELTNNNNLLYQQKQLFN